MLKLIFSLSAAPTKRFVLVKTHFDLIFFLLKVADLSYICGEEQRISVDGVFMDSAGCSVFYHCYSFLNHDGVPVSYYMFGLTVFIWSRI